VWDHSLFITMNKRLQKAILFVPIHDMRPRDIIIKLMIDLFRYEKYLVGCVLSSLKLFNCSDNQLIGLFDTEEQDAIFEPGEIDCGMFI